MIHFRGINKLDFSVNQRFYHSHLARASVVVPVLVSHGVVVIVGNSVVVSCALSWCGLRWSILASARGFPIPFHFGTILYLFVSSFIVLGSLTG